MREIGGQQVRLFRSTSSRGFSLPEILAVVAILGVLSAVVMGAVNSVLATAAKSREINAARQLIAAYHLAAIDTGEYLPGFDRTVNELEWENGIAVHGPAANRYPYRLGPYFGHQLEGIILVNENAKQVDSSDTYSVSLSPAFGINYLFVGGERSASGVLSIPGEVASRPAHGANVLVFASAGRKYGNSITHGFNLLTPPRIYGSMWASAEWNPDASPGNYGHIHARHNSKAICAFLDGSVRLLGVEELRDMRLWSMRAAENNDPNYTVTAASRPGGR